MSGVLWSCAPDVGRISSTNSTKSSATILSMVGPRGHRTIEVERGVVLPDHRPAASSCRRKLPSPSASNRLMTIGITAALVGHGLFGPRGAHVGQLRGSASAPAGSPRATRPPPARPPPRAIRRAPGPSGGCRGDRGAGRRDQPACSASSSCGGARSRRNPYTKERPSARTRSAWTFSAGSSPDDGVKTPDEKRERARGLRGRLAPRVRVIAGGSRRRRRRLWRRGRRRSRDVDALATRAGCG